MSAGGKNVGRHPRVSACGMVISDPQDLVKIEIFTFLSQLAEMGHASLSPLADGETEVRLASGEVFLFGEATVTRLN